MFRGVSPSLLCPVRTGGGHISMCLHGIFRVLRCNDDGLGIHRVLKREAMLSHWGVRWHVSLSMVIGCLAMFGCA